MNDIYKQFQEISKGMENLSKVILYKKMIENLQEEKEESEDAMIDFSIGILEDAIKYRTKCELEGTAENKWTPTSEKLPEDGTWNIWQSKTGALSIERYKEDAYDHFYPSGRFFSLEDAVAWMPLPERYKEETYVERGEDKE